MPTLQQQQKLLIYYQNINGLRTKTNQIYKNVNNLPHDFIVFTETWLCNSMADAELLSFQIFCISMADAELLNFQIFRRDSHSDNESTRVGGVNDFQQTDYEIICINIKINMDHGNLNIVAVYIPPTTWNMCLKT